MHGKPPALGVLPEPPARTGPSCQEAAAVLPEQTADLEATEQPAPALASAWESSPACPAPAPPGGRRAARAAVDILPEPPAELEAASLTVHPAVSLDARR